MKQYKNVNNLVGWITFIIAATVYCMTIEPTASFWDCPEFITTGYKLEVGHPPGAPFFMLVANLFSQFASDATTVAKMVNYMSALMSGACILFLFWSITHLVRKLVVKDENNITAGQMVTIMGSGLVGALAYTFSDTFWFSAVEGEVYAFSSLFTAVVFWLILKWEDVANEPHSDRWLILIAYLTGLSIGVHLLNLLCTMMIVIGYSSYALIVIRSTANTPMDQNSPEDIFTLGEYLGREQYGTRPLFYGPAFSSQVALDVKDGYCEPRISYNGTKFIRKEKATPDEKDSYLEIPGRIEYEYAQNMLFPRMYSSAHTNEYHRWQDIKGEDVPYDKCGEMVMVNMPTQWENIKFFFSYQLNWMYWRYFMWNFAGRQNDLQGSGEIEHGNWITGINAIDKLLVGDQTLLPQELRDNKGHNVFYCLPLLLGIIGLLWQAYRGQKGIQQFWVVFFLFFMTGIAIVLYLNQTPTQPRERDYAYAGSFYAFAIWIGMGVAGLIQLIDRWTRKRADDEEMDDEAREQIRKTGYPLVPSLVSALVISAVCLLVPIQMASQTWDDHDRSDRYVCRDFGQNYLMSLQESGNPVIFTNGDNDTFPLWYNQETEGFRTDARTCNLSYLQTDWYIDQMKRPAYDSPSLPITWDRMEYVEGTNEYVPIRPDYKKSIDALYAEAEKQALNGNPEALVNVKKEFGDDPYEVKNILKYWVRNKNQDLKVIPTDSLVIKVDKEAVRRSGMLIPGDSIPDYMHISLKGKRALYKSELMMLEMLSEANWERPIYIAVSVGTENQLGMANHFMQEGLAYRFTPFDTDKLGVKIDSEKMYDNLMNKFKFGGIDKPGIYIDENTMRMCHSHRRIFSQLVQQLMREGKKDKAKAALDYAEKVIPNYNVPYDWQNGAVQMAEAYYQLGDSAKADEMMQVLADKAVEYLTWYLSLDDDRFSVSTREFEYHWAVLDAEAKMMKKYDSKLAEIYEPKVEELYNMYMDRLKQVYGPMMDKVSK